MTQDNPIIKKRFEEKMARLDKTSASILVSWATNCAIACLTEKQKSPLDWELIKGHRDLFIEMYREWMIENMPAENGKLGKLTSEQVKSQSEGEKWQENYNEMSKIDEVNAELAEEEEIKQ